MINVNYDKGIAIIDGELEWVLAELGKATMMVYSNMKKEEGEEYARRKIVEVVSLAMIPREELLKMAELNGFDASEFDESELD